MKANSGPAISTICRKIRACRSCSAFNCLDQEKHWSPKLRRYRPRSRHDQCSSDSDPAPGPSGVSHVSRKPLDTEGHSRKGRREEDEMEKGSASKKSRSKSPRRGKTKTWRRIAEARRRKRHPNPSSSSSEEKMATQKEWRLHGLGYTPAECVIDNASDENEVKEETPTYPPDDVAHDASKYKIVRPLCQGDFGVIFKAVRLVDQLPVVIKCIFKHSVPFTEMEVKGILTRLPVEAYLLMRVGAGPDDADASVAPRLLDWYDLGPEVALIIESPHPCMDLVDYIREEKTNGVPVPKARIIFRQLVEAAIEMEAKGVFHRDIKPENVLIEPREDVPRARFIDFGSGVTCTTRQRFKEPHGTLEYLTPEWLRNTSYTSTSATAWQLGLTLFVMLFNKKPLVKESAIASTRAPTSRNLHRKNAETS